MLNPFRIHTPETLESACAFLAEHGPDAAIYAGGTELLLAMKEGLVTPDYLVDVKGLGIGAIALGETGEVRLGATARHREIEAFAAAHEPLRALAELERQVANVRVRNQGTIGGNLCFGEPHADPGVLLAAWDAEVELVDPLGGRRLAIGEFLLDEFTTALEDGEVMTAVIVPPQPARSASAYLRFGFLERPSLGVAARLTLAPGEPAVAHAAVAVGAIGPCPERLPGAEQALTGAGLHGEEWATAVRLAAEHASDECRAEGDAHGAEDYKRHLVGVHVRRVLERCRGRLQPVARTERRAA